MAESVEAREQPLAAESRAVQDCAAHRYYVSTYIPGVTVTKLKALWLYLVDTFNELLDIKSAIEDADPAPCKCSYRYPIVIRDTMKYEGRTIFFVTCLSCNRTGTSQITAPGAVRAWNDKMKG